MAASRQSAWQDTLRQAWTRRGLIACCLWPVSRLYGALITSRRWLFRCKLLKTENIDVPVLVVGNVVAGGVGKTPVVMALVTHYQTKGLKVGVVSRGYGRRSTGCHEVTETSSASQVGDEPSLIRHRTHAPVFVAERRIEAARALLAAHPQTQLIISDDGLQHLAMHRDLEIGVFDDRGVGNGWLLPAGPLRESWPRRLDWVLHTGQHPAFAGFQATRALATFAVRADGSQVPLNQFARAADQPHAKPLLALAAIAQPEVFFAMLRDQNIVPDQCIGLPDHHDFDSDNLSFYEGYNLICTEKDAVKLWAVRPDAMAVPLICTLPAAFLEQLDTRTSCLLSGTKIPC